MKKWSLIIFIFLPVFGIGQTAQHNFFGIDLNSDWRSLTNFQKLTFFLIGNDTPKENPYVVTDFHFSHSKIDREFIDLGFQELLLCFPKNENVILDTLKPEIFLSRYYYNSNEYKSNSQIDMARVKSLLVERYGEPGLNVVKEDFSTLTWQGVYYKVVLTTRKEDLTTTLMYVKE
jgi:hypothetical protein